MRTETLDSLCIVNPETLGPNTSPTFRFRYIDISSVTKGQINWPSTRRLNLADAPSRARRVVTKGDVLLCTVRPGLQAHARLQADGEPLVCSTGFAVLRPRTKGDSGFIFHQLFSHEVVVQLRALETGSNYPAVNERDVCGVRVYAPEPEERRRIAAVLDAVDEAIAKTDAVIAKLRHVRAGLLHDLLARGLDEKGELRDPVAHPEQFQDSPLGRIPREWRVATIGAICELGRGRVISQLDLEQTPGNYPVYSSQSANDGVFGYLGTFDFEGDYVTWTTDGANAGTVFFRNGRFNCTNVCGTLKSRGQVTERFIALAFGVIAKKFVSYVGNPKLMNNTVTHVPIAFPRSLEEQNAATDALKMLDCEIATEERELEKLQNLKSGLMGDLLTGRVRVPEGVITTSP